MQILISSCVLGNNVRWNAGNKADSDIREWADSHGFELVPVCPEDALFGTPRQPIRLHQVADQTLAMMGERNVYPELVSKCREIFDLYPGAVGYIGIAKSPSCGISVGVKGAGRTMKAPMHSESSIPTTEINSMKTPAGRESFRKRVVKWAKSQVKPDSLS